MRRLHTKFQNASLDTEFRSGRKKRNAASSTHDELASIGQPARFVRVARLAASLGEVNRSLNCHGAGGTISPKSVTHLRLSPRLYSLKHRCAAKHCDSGEQACRGKPQRMNVAFKRHRRAEHAQQCSKHGAESRCLRAIASYRAECKSPGESKDRYSRNVPAIIVEPLRRSRKICVRQQRSGNDYSANESVYAKCDHRQSSGAPEKSTFHG